MMGGTGKTDDMYVRGGAVTGCRGLMILLPLVPGAKCAERCCLRARRPRLRARRKPRRRSSLMVREQAPPPLPPLLLPLLRLQKAKPRAKQMRLRPLPLLLALSLSDHDAVMFFTKRLQISKMEDDISSTCPSAQTSMTRLHCQHQHSKQQPSRHPRPRPRPAARKELLALAPPRERPGRSAWSSAALREHSTQDAASATRRATAPRTHIAPADSQCPGASSRTPV
jgi:hypothetical protein